MSNIKKIREKINGIRNIQKLAKAMEMVAVAKMHKAQKRMLISQPYAEIVRKVINHISLGKLEYKHTYFLERDIQCVGYWVISSDRGLTGGLNINLFRMLLCDINKWSKLGIKTKLSIIGAKALSFFNYIDTSIIVSYVSDIGDTPKMSDLIGSVKIMLQLYDNKKIDRLYLIYNKFVNNLVQTPRSIQILPISSEESTETYNRYWDYIYEPDSQILLHSLLQRYIESQIYQGVLENLASEQSARMVAMKNAADNGEVLINNLKLLYNKVRQTKITQELIEIISGTAVI